MVVKKDHGVEGGTKLEKIEYFSHGADDSWKTNSVLMYGTYAHWLFVSITCTYHAPPEAALAKSPFRSGVKRQELRLSCRRAAHYSQVFFV